MKKVAIVLIAVMALASCAKVLMVADMVLRFIDTVDTQKEKYCGNGYIPQVVCDKYEDLKASAKENWEKYKAEFLAWVAQFLAGELVTGEPGPAADYAKPDATPILNAAELALTYKDYMMLKAASER